VESIRQFARGERGVRATVLCTPDETCSLFVEWEWERILIAHTYWAEGSFVTLYQAKSGHEPHLMGVLRTGTSTRGFAKDRWSYLEPKLVDSNCVELKVVPTPTKTRRRVATEMLSPPGRYCVGPSGFVPMNSHGVADGGVPAWP
jgi:hypothetical protein